MNHQQRTSTKNKMTNKQNFPYQQIRFGEIYMTNPLQIARVV